MKNPIIKFLKHFQPLIFSFSIFCIFASNMLQNERIDSKSLKNGNIVITSKIDDEDYFKKYLYEYLDLVKIAEIKEKNKKDFN
jgi:hypothetical protein